MPPGWGSRTYLAFGAFDILAGYANPLGLSVAGACQLWLDPCTLRSLVRTDVVVLDAAGMPAFPGISLSGAAFNQTCAAASSGKYGSYFRRFPWYSADVPANRITMLLGDSGAITNVRSNSSQLDYAFPPQNLPAAWVYSHPSTKEGMLCCTFDYVPYPTCNRSLPACPNTCIAGIILVGTVLLLIFSTCLGCALKRQQLLLHHSLQKDAKLLPGQMTMDNTGADYDVRHHRGSGGDANTFDPEISTPPNVARMGCLDLADEREKMVEGGSFRAPDSETEEAEEAELVRRIAVAEEELLQMEQASVVLHPANETLICETLPKLQPARRGTKFCLLY